MMLLFTLVIFVYLYSIPTDEISLWEEAYTFSIDNKNIFIIDGKRRR